MVRRKGKRSSSSQRSTGAANLADVTCHLSTTRKHQGPNGVTSSYIGVTQYRRTGKWEAHIWLKSKVGAAGDARRSGGRQVHLGTYMHAADAAVAYDRAARRFREPGCALNFNPDLYEDDWFLRTHSALDEDAFVLQLREFAYALLNKHKELEEQRQPVLPALHHRAVDYSTVEPTPVPPNGLPLRPHQLRQLAAMQRQGGVPLGGVSGARKRNAALAAAMVAAEEGSSSDGEGGGEGEESDQDYSPSKRAPRRRPGSRLQLCKAESAPPVGCRRPRCEEEDTGGPSAWGPLPHAMLPHPPPRHSVATWLRTTPHTPMRSPSPVRAASMSHPPPLFGVHAPPPDATPAPMTDNPGLSQAPIGRSPNAEGVPRDTPQHDSAADILLIHFKSPNLSQETSPPATGSTPLVAPALLITSPCGPPTHPLGNPFDFVVNGSPMISPGTLLTPSLYSPAAQVQGHSLHLTEGGEEPDLFATLQASCMSLQF